MSRVSTNPASLASCHQLHAAAEADARAFFQGISERMACQGDLAVSVLQAAQQHSAMIHQLHQDGLVILRGYFPAEIILRLGKDVEALVEARKGVLPVRAHSQETSMDLMKGTYRYFTDEFLREFDCPLETLVSSVGIQDPLVTLADVSTLVFDQGILERATGYYGAIPLVTFLKTRFAFANTVPPADTQLFHVDGGSYRIFKALIYLNDVEEGGGPFCYVKGSHRHKWDGWDQKARYEDAEIEEVYGAENILRCYAKAGDVILANTAGIHRGEKPRKANRGILIVNYCVHPEYGFEHPDIRIPAKTKYALSSFCLRAADNLVEVEVS